VIVHFLERLGDMIVAYKEETMLIFGHFLIWLALFIAIAHLG